MKIRHLNGLYPLLRNLQGKYASLLVFSAVINMLMLTPAWYMLQVYDRVLTSRDENTLFGLSLLAIFFYLVYGLLSKYRGYLLNVISEEIDKEITRKLHVALFTPTSIDYVRQKNPLADLNIVKNFLTGQPILSFIDAPWIPIYLVTIALLNSSLGWIALISSVFLFLLAILNEKFTRDQIYQAQEFQRAEHNLVINVANSYESIHAMGMRRAIKEKLLSIRQGYLNSFLRASTRGVKFSSISDSFRFFLQSLMLGYGAYLAINQEITAGMIIAGSILLGRALSPIDGIINSQKYYAEFIKSLININKVIETSSISQHSIELGRPKGKIQLIDIELCLSSNRKPVLEKINLIIDEGESIAIVGPSGAGKSSLMKVLCGIYKPSKGQVLIDGIDLSSINFDYLGQHFGYLSETVDLCSGKISENIARFGDIDSKSVLEAAKISGLHDSLAGLPEGYETVLGDFGFGLSEGQKRKIGLARAIYQNPSVIFLDEPGNGLDILSMGFVVRLISHFKNKRTTLIYTTHQSSLAQLADKLLVIVDSQIRAYGKTSEVVKALNGKENFYE